MFIPRNLKERLFPILVNRTAIFFLIMSFLTLFLYTIGTMQGFVDSTQLSLLSFYVIMSSCLVLASVCGTVINILRFRTQKKARYLLRAAGYLLLVLFGAVAVLTVMFIFTLSAGNGAA